MIKRDGGRKGEGAGELVLHEGEWALKVTIINAALSDESIYNQHYYTARSLRLIREGVTCKWVDGYKRNIHLQCNQRTSASGILWSFERARIDDIDDELRNRVTEFPQEESQEMGVEKLKKSRLLSHSLYSKFALIGREAIKNHNNTN